MNDKKTAAIVWQGTDLDFQGSLGSGYEFALSGSAGAKGGSPMEFMLAGVAGCTAMDVVHMLRKMRQQVSGVEVHIVGTRAGEHPKVYTEVELLYVVRGLSIEASAVEKAIHLSQATYCSASIMFKQAGVVLQTQYRIEAEPSEG